MKLKYSILASMLAVSIALLPQATLALESPDKGAPGAEDFSITISASENVEAATAEDIASEQVIIPADTLIDFTVPTVVDGEEITKIGAGCFKGCDVIKSVTIPAVITEIGADAFADCPYLEVIYFEGRADAEDLILGENWNGGVEVVFLLADEAEEEQQPVVDIPAAAPSDEDASEPSEDGNVPAEPSDEQPEPADDAAPADDAQPTDEPSEPTDGSQEPAEAPSDTPVSEEPVVSEDAAAGEETPPSGDQPSDASEGTATETAVEPSAEPAADAPAE